MKYDNRFECISIIYTRDFCISLVIIKTKNRYRIINTRKNSFSETAIHI